VCTAVSEDVADELLNVSKDEKTAEYPYDAYEIPEHLGRVVIYFSECSGCTCLICEDGFIAWKETGAEKGFFTTNFGSKRISEVIQKIKDNYEQGAKNLGGVRFYSPGDGTSAHRRNVHLQILDEKLLQRDFWTESTIDYYEKRGVDSIDIHVDDYKKIVPFDVIFTPTAENYYLPRGKQRTEELSKEEVVMMISRLKEDISHFLFCKHLILSLLPTNRDSLEVMELRIKNDDRCLALRYGKKISEYRWVYTDKKFDKDATNVNGIFPWIFATPKTDSDDRTKTK
jgi:hypothetical protein